MANRLTVLKVPDDEQSVRIEFPNGQTFRLRMPDDDTIRFQVDTDHDVRMMEFYGRGGRAIVSLTIVRDGEIPADD
jgi:hypothetical protein